MPAPLSKAPRLFARIATHAWWVLLLVALALLWLAAGRRIAHVEAVTNLPTWSADAPAHDAASPTGFAHGQRRLIVPGHHNPSFWWITEAQLAAKQGRLRLRHINYDAQPNGRDIRRTAPYRWWLTAVGWLHGLVHGEPLGYAIGRGALVADPLLLTLMLVLGAAYSARTLGPFAAAGLVVGGISLFPLAAGFQPGAPDPHSLAWVLALGSILPLLASPQRVGARRRIHFVIAGICGGLGFWNDATSQAPVLLAIGLGAVAYELLRARDSGQPSSAPSPWRAWALAGALTTLAASVFEFAPHYFSWSLDSVNPIHALAWWGAGEVLQAVAAWSREGRRAFGWRMPVLLGLGVIALAAWPVTGILSHSGGLLAPDFYARQLANLPGDLIASRLGPWLNRSGEDGAKWATLLPCVLCLVFLARILLGKAGWEARGRLAFVLVAMLVVAVLAVEQLRWWNLFDVFALAGLTAWFSQTDTEDLRASGTTLATALLVLPGLFVGFPPAVAGNVADHLSREEAQGLIERDFAYWLVKRAGSEPEVLFSTPIFSSAAAFYGGFKVVDSADTRNKVGYDTAIQLASANSVQAITVLLNTCGITHVALPLWDGIMDQFVRIGQKLSASQPLPKSAFVVSLQDWAIPPWMRTMEYVIPDRPGFHGFQLRVFGMQPEQARDLRFSRLADYFLECGQLRAAQAVAESLKAYPRSVPALGAIANVNLALRDQTGLQETLDKLIPYLSRSWARNLPPDRRISLAALFIRTDHTDLARQQLTACMRRLNRNTLRMLSTGNVVQLVALSRVLDIPFPNPDLEAAAIGLMPPATRARFLQK